MIEELRDDTAFLSIYSALMKPYLLVHEAVAEDARATYLYEPLPQFTRLLHERLSGY